MQSENDELGRTVGEVWFRSLDWLDKNMSYDESSGESPGSSPQLQYPPPSRERVMWQQAQDLVRSSCVVPDPLASFEGFSDEAGTHERNLDAIIASCGIVKQLLLQNRGLDGKQPAVRPSPYTPLIKASPNLLSPLSPLSLSRSRLWERAGERGAGARAPGPDTRADGGHGLQGGGWDDLQDQSTAFADPGMGSPDLTAIKTEDPPIITIKEEAQAHSPPLPASNGWAPLPPNQLMQPGAAHGVPHQGMLARQCMPPVPLGLPPPLPYTNGLQCASCLKHFEADRFSGKLKAVCTKPFSRQQDQRYDKDGAQSKRATTVRNFPGGHSLCTPCYKVTETPALHFPPHRPTACAAWLVCRWICRGGGRHDRGRV